MRELIGPRPDDKTEALQASVASFTRYGFEAAAVTGFAVRASAVAGPLARGIERTAILRFDHPYAALAIAGRPHPPGLPSQTSEASSPFAGMPLFSAWVHEPAESEDAPPAARGSEKV